MTKIKFKNGIGNVFNVFFPVCMVMYLVNSHVNYTENFTAHIAVRRSNSNTHNIVCIYIYIYIYIVIHIHIHIYSNTHDNLLLCLSILNCIIQIINTMYAEPLLDLVEYKTGKRALLTASQDGLISHASHRQIRSSNHKLCNINKN